MKCDEFISLAKKIAKQNKPAYTRSAISRAYYAFYHTVQEYFRLINLPKNLINSLNHTSSPEALQNTGEDDLMEIGEQLKTRKSTRHRADYFLKDTDVEDSGTAKNFVRDCQDQIRKVKIFEKSTNNSNNIIRSRIMKYINNRDGTKYN